MNINPRLISIGLTAGLFGAAAFALAPGQHERLEAFDLDRNGRFSMAEVDRAAADIFARADADRDGTLTVAERRALHGASAGGEGRHADGEDEGPMRLAAFQAHLRQHATAADTNRDGELSMAEIEAMHRSERR